MLRFSVFAFALALAGLASPGDHARAAAFPAIGQLADAGHVRSQGLVQKVHGCHHYGVHGWVGHWGYPAYHRHVGPYCEPVPAGHHPYYKPHHYKPHYKKHHYKKHHHHKKPCIHVGGVTICP